MQNFNTITFDNQDGIGLLTLNRPEKFNAFSMEMIEELFAVFDSLMDDYTCRVVVITGAGKAFCAGADLKMMATLDYADLKGRTLEFWKIQKMAARLIQKMNQIPQPMIAAVNGIALGGGMCLTLPADIRIASKRAKFSAAFINVGLTGSDMGSSYYLPRIVGLTRASEIVLTGRSVDAEEAYRIGLVTQIAEEEALVATGMGIAKVLLEKSGVGLTLTKEALKCTYDCSFEGMTNIENRNQTLAGLSGSWEEALAMFLQK